MTCMIDPEHNEKNLLMITKKTIFELNAMIQLIGDNFVPYSFEVSCYGF